MSKFTDKILYGTADMALKAYTSSAEFASRGFGYEPEMSQEAKEYKAEHTSRIEQLYKKLLK